METATKFKISTSNKEFFYTIEYADSLPSGYGHRKITIEVECEGESKLFTATTNCMPLYDKAMELDGQNQYEALYFIEESVFDGLIQEWLWERELI